MGAAPAEWEWDALSAAALEAYRAARREEAVHLWRRAGALAQDFPAGDPRRAASENNRAIALLIDHDHDDAARALSSALASWDGALEWTRGMSVAAVARSSLFHQRLEQRHVETYADVRRARHRDFLSGAAALTRFNLAIAGLFLDRDDTADRLLETALAERERAFGPNNGEVAEIARVLSGRADAAGDDARMEVYDARVRSAVANRAEDVLDAWRREQPLEMNDTRRLLAAAYLTAIVHERDFL
ncbi:MAG: hypothetical protein OXI22_12655 [Defluviicoccus sp.]|nr:hypothetical protein [Defluviicoccus sp.]MDE0384730.1 hypothetical protein [Defluviicoccus sp.]